MYIDPMTSKLYTGLKRGKNYELVPQEAWIKFVDMYSLSDKSEPIERYKNFMCLMYMFLLYLHLYVGR